MFNWLFKKKASSQLGVDLGRSAIKVVELTKKGGRPHLLNYAIAQPKTEDLRLTALKNEDIADILKSLISQAQITSKYANISLPVDKTFTTIMDMTAMPEAELAAAIPYEAQKYVPVPIDEVVLDWSIIPKTTSDSAATDGIKPAEIPGMQKNPVQILVVAVPKDIINNLTKVAKLAGLEVLALEQEAFSLTRALVGNDSGTYLIADFGRQGTDLIVVEQGLIRLSHGLEAPAKEVLLMEIDRIVNLYQMRYNKKVGTCVLTGGRAAQKEIVDFLSSKLKIQVRLGDPLARVEHLTNLGPITQELGLQLAVSIGLAMRE